METEVTELSDDIRDDRAIRNDRANRDDRAIRDDCIQGHSSLPALKHTHERSCKCYCLLCQLSQNGWDSTGNLGLVPAVSRARQIINDVPG